MIEDGGFPIKQGTDLIAKPRESKMFNGKKYILEESIFGDFALIKAWRADKHGNL